MKLLLKKAVVATAILLCTAWGAAAAAETVPALGVSNAAGKAGDTVEVVVNIQGIAAIEGVEGISGGELVMVYDSALADVKKADQGEAISGFMFIRNLRLSENSIKVVWASGSRLTSEDGEICRVTFTMKQDGVLRPTLKDLVLFDQDVHPLQVTAIEPPPDGEKPPPGGEQDSGDNGTAGEDPAGNDEVSGDKWTAKEGAAQYSIGPPDKTAPDSGSPGGGQENTQGPTGGDAEIPDQTGGESASPAAPHENKPGLNALPWIILGGVIILGLAGYFVFRKYRQARQS